jgi:hypothetical protein
MARAESDEQRIGPDRSPDGTRQRLAPACRPASLPIIQDRFSRAELPDGATPFPAHQLELPGESLGAPVDEPVSAMHFCTKVLRRSTSTR